MASWWIKGSKVALIFGIFIAVPAVQFHGQEKPQVAPSAKTDTYVQDESGKVIRVQAREIAPTNFRIAGVDAAGSDDLLDQAMKVLGQTGDVASDDDDDRDEVCYRSDAPHDSTHLVFGEGDSGHFFVLSADSSSWTWMTPCKASAKIGRDVTTVSGLRLGETQEQVIAILGLPSDHDRNGKSGLDEMRYYLEAGKKLSPQEMAPALQDELQYNPKLDQKAWVRDNCSYSLWSAVDAVFRDDHLVSLKIVWTESE